MPGEVAGQNCEPELAERGMRGLSIQPWLMSDTPGQSSKNSSEDSSCEQQCKQGGLRGQAAWVYITAPVCTWRP